MKFDQAFYTREDAGTALQIYASSKEDRDFKNNCQTIGDSLNNEPESSRSAELVYFSTAFKKYVGVGITPAPYEDGTGNRRIVHMLVPDSVSTDPSDIYLAYRFDKTYSRGRRYDEIEMEPCLSKVDYSNIIRKFHFTKKSLADLFRKVMPVIFGDINQLFIVLSPDLYDEEIVSTARELMWMLSALIPVPDDQRTDCYDKLSYAVFSSENTGKVKFPFLTEIPGKGKYYRLEAEREEGTQDLDSASGSDKEDMYDILAGKAMGSLSDYKKYIGDIFRAWPVSKADLKSIRCAVFFHELQKYPDIIEQHPEKIIHENDIPDGFMDCRKEKSKNNKEYRESLYRLVLSIEEMGYVSLGFLFLDVFKEGNHEETEASDKLKTDAYLGVLKMAHRLIWKGTGKSHDFKETGNEEKLKAFSTFLQISDDDVLKKSLQYEWKDGGSASATSFIAEDIEKIETIEDFIEILNMYAPLAGDDTEDKSGKSFQQKMVDLLQEENGRLYFAMENGQREDVRTRLNIPVPVIGHSDNRNQEIKVINDQEVISKIVKGKLEPLKTDSQNSHTKSSLDNESQYNEFFDNELKQKDPAVFPALYHYLLEICQKAARFARKIIQGWLAKFLNADTENRFILEKDKNEFEKLDRKWRLADYREKLKTLSFEDLASYNWTLAGGYDPDLDSEYAIAWIERMREVDWHIEGDDAQEEVLGDLINSYKTVKKLVDENDLEDYKTAMRQYCDRGSNSRLNIKLFLKAKDVLGYTFSKIYKIAKGFSEKASIPGIFEIMMEIEGTQFLDPGTNHPSDNSSKPDVLGNHCYDIWKENNNNVLISIPDIVKAKEAAEQDKEFFDTFISQLREEITKGPDYKPGRVINYFRLYQVIDRAADARGRCGDYQRIRDEKSGFSEFISKNNCKDKEDQETGKILDEFHMFGELVGALPVTRENVVKKTRLLHEAEQVFICSETKDSEPDIITSIREGIEQVEEQIKNKPKELEEEKNSISKKLENTDSDISQKTSQIEETERALRNQKEELERIQQKRDGLKDSLDKMEEALKAAKAEKDRILEEISKARRGEYSVNPEVNKIEPSAGKQPRGRSSSSEYSYDKGENRKRNTNYIYPEGNNDTRPGSNKGNQTADRDTQKLRPGKVKKGRPGKTGEGWRTCN